MGRRPERRWSVDDQWVFRYRDMFGWYTCHVDVCTDVVRTFNAQN